MDDSVDSNQQKLSPVNGDKRDTEQPVPSPTTAIKSPKRQEDEETANDADLSPPPDSSSVSSVNPDMLGDEIVVGTRANGNKNSPQRITSDKDDEDAADSEASKPVTHYPKRKRASMYDDLGEDKMEHSLLEDVDDIEAVRLGGKQRHGTAGAKNVILGYWRDSQTPSVKGKHAVIGFMDIRDRLRTRIQNVTRDGTLINTRLFPVPPGPGGSWVTFERIVFEPHLVGLDHNEVKEYVKIRADVPLESDPEAREKAERAAVEEAKRRLEANPPPDTAQPPPMAYGLEIPEINPNRPEVKRRRVGSSIGTMSERPALTPQAPQQPTPIVQSQAPPQALDNLAGKRPTRILVGCWGKSSAEDPRDKHAVYGILGANDMFRVKLVRETMDGRFLEGNFPNGAGALWISYEDVVFLPHLRNLSRPEMKEYVRVRQFQIDNGETEEERAANETRAVYEAQSRATAISRAHVPGNNDLALRQAGPMERERDDGQDMAKSELPSSGHELRHARREVLPRNDGPSPRLPYPPEADMRQGSRLPSSDPLERVQDLATREVARMEAVQLRNDRHESNRMMALDPTESRRQFQENRVRMQHAWDRQEQNRMRAGSERGVNSDDAKVHMGIKYERRQNGPFSGKLVSQGTIISIDGEDYVEYRVLTKPTFF
ncbi:hypothetical protein F5X96DRAFT_436354 [Biscogniauxia mediterranea]|nr:hypothetical protein F5X96DRAFT_436354 [Biscogniauxia mediterranea]